jgi:hypothetical protein
MVGTGKGVGNSMILPKAFTVCPPKRVVCKSEELIYIQADALTVTFKVVLGSLRVMKDIFRAVFYFLIGNNA